MVVFRQGTAVSINLFLYMQTAGGRKDEILSAVSPFVSEGRLEVLRSLRSLAARMRGPKEALSIALIWNPTKGDLLKIALMKDLLRGVRILFVLSDQDRETIKLAHKVFPTYITYVDDDISKIVAVLKRLTKAPKTGSGTEAGCR
jgi:hypothetical protein